MNKSRNQFEEYFSDKHDLTMKHFGDPVIKFTMDRLFEVWQASRESLEIEFPKRKSICDNEFEDCFLDGVDKCRAILLDSGVKVK